MSRTATGFEMKLTGHNPRFAKYLELSVDKLVIGPWWSPAPSAAWWA